MAAAPRSFVSLTVHAVDQQVLGTGRHVRLGASDAVAPGAEQAFTMLSRLRSAVVLSLGPEARKKIPGRVDSENGDLYQTIRCAETAIF